MAARRELVSCCTHGARPAAFVCRHVLESLRTGSRVGFHTPGDAKDEDQGWCNACERVRAVRANGTTASRPTPTSN